MRQVINPRICIAFSTCILYNTVIEIDDGINVLGDSSVTAGELYDADAFFAPAPFDLFDTLMGQYASTRRRLEALAETVNSDACAGVLHYFIEANAPQERLSSSRRTRALFELAPAIAQLDADFWNRALRMTDVLDVMPQKRRSEWFDQIENPLGVQAQRLNQYELDRGAVQPEWKIEPIPAFEADTVRATLQHLIDMRYSFFAERVDGIFQRLSRDHATNCPQGFGKRMILQRAVSSGGSSEHETAGYINDLRCVVARFMGRDEPHWTSTAALIQVCRDRTGQWVSIDGGAMRMRVYRGVGTGHLEVHPDMAWRLNAVLASMYPMAIPAEFRERPKKARKVKDVQLFSKPLPFVVLNYLMNMKPGFRYAGEDRSGDSRYEKVPNTRRFDYDHDDATIRAQVIRVLEAIGGVAAKEKHFQQWVFDYDVGPVISDIVCSGVIPDHQAHQFYPTPATIAEVAVRLASEGDAETMQWLEPSAGIGGLADLMPKDRTACVEVSELHCAILRAKGHSVIQGDFLSVPAVPAYQRVLMNPPYSGGRWQAHTQHAARMLAPGGRLVAILPASAPTSFRLDGMSMEWSAPYANQFAGTTISVVILVAEKQG